MFPAMGSEEYRKLFYAAGLSAISLWALIAARSWLAYDLAGGQAWASGLVSFAAIGPWVLAPIGGALADRYDRARVVMYCRVGACLTAVMLGVLALTGTIALWNIILITFLSGVIRSAEMPAQQALLANTVKAAALLSAITLASTMQFGSKVIGPLSGPMQAVIGEGPVFFLAAAILALSVWQMKQIKIRSTGGIQAGTRGIMRDTYANIMDGVRYLGRAPSVRLVIILVALHCMFTMAFDFSLLPAYADRVLEGDSNYNGFLLMAVGGGALIATIGLSMVPTGAVRGRILLVVGIVSGLSLVLLGSVNTLWAALLGCMLAGGSQAMYMALSSVLIQAVVPDAYRGRVMALYAMFAGGIMSAMILANGVVADHIDLRILMIGPGAVFAVISVAMLVLPSVRSIIRHGELVEEIARLAALASARTERLSQAAATALDAARPAPQHEDAVAQKGGSAAGGGGGGAR